MSLAWLGTALVLPFAVGLAVAWPLWARRVSDDMAAIAGSALILAFAVAFIGREYAEIEAVLKRCVPAQIGCRLQPAPFTRYAIYAGIAMCQVFSMFAVGLSIQERLRERDRRI